MTIAEKTMSEPVSTILAIVLDLAMIVYTLWILSLSHPSPALRLRIGAILLGWLSLLYLGLSSKQLFPGDISGIAFLLIIFGFVGIVGASLLLTPLRSLLFSLDQKYLLLFQGIRVFFGANFLMQASTGNLPMVFGILDGWTHISAGFFGLIAAFSLAINNRGKRRAWFANLFGLGDIVVVASSLALILLPKLTPHHAMMYAVFLPAPLWLWFHVISIWKLIVEPNNSSLH
jgi:hypothetical protein